LESRTSRGTSTFKGATEKMKARELIFEGRQLCSSRDPLKEARIWCDLMLASEKNGPSGHYWVIGLGAGYHIEELARRRNESVISVIEGRESLAHTFSSWGKALHGQVLIENISSSAELFESPSFLIYGLEFSSIFRFAPCLQGAESWASCLEADLLGRSAIGFKTISKLMNISVPSDRIQNNCEISIKTIDSFFDGAPMSEEKKIVSLLKELVR
jgi:hypothetical protein